MAIAFYSFLVLAASLCDAAAFQSSNSPRVKNWQSTATAIGSSGTATTMDELRAIQKEKLLGLIRPMPAEDPVLADPITKEGLVIVPSTATLIGGQQQRTGNGRGAGVKYTLRSKSNTYTAWTDGYINLLEPVQDKDNSDEDDSSDSSSTSSSSRFEKLLQQNVLPLIPPQIRSALATAGLPMGKDYIPMRDLFTSPAVSFAYERGWRQGFASAGFPGADQEAQLAMDYLEPSMERYDSSRVLVDMSCATGLFTRRFAKSGKYKRVLGCDYSPSMLEEARRRIQLDRDLRISLQQKPKTALDLVRLDVGQISMKDASVDGLHAGAAMHCWPDLPMAASEIYRVLKPGGRYFATTFLSSWFGTLQAMEGGTNGPSRQAFQYFESTDQLKDLMVSGGFAREKVDIEVLGRACVVIRCEK